MTPEAAKDLAITYAPVFAQKVSDEWVIADQIAPVDLAGSIAEVAKNPKELERRDEEDPEAVLPATVYYSVCETTTHYFLLYAVYHVLDWWKRVKPTDLYNLIRDSLDEHMHDMEGALLVVTKEPRRQVDGLITVSHKNFYLYTEPRLPKSVGKSAPTADSGLRIAKFNENVDGHVWVDKATQRIKLYIESRGHGMRGDHKHWGGGEQIWYYRPKGEAVEAGTLDKNEKKTKTVDYDLVDIFEPGGLWDHRFDGSVFRQHQDGRWGFVYFKDEKNEKLEASIANPPWSWNDHNDTSPAGELATDPARFIVRYAQGWGPVSTQYLHNRYQRINE
jgi:hypothetical protein